LSNVQRAFKATTAVAGGSDEQPTNNAFGERNQFGTSSFRPSGSLVGRGADHDHLHQSRLFLRHNDSLNSKQTCKLEDATRATLPIVTVLSNFGASALQIILAERSLRLRGPPAPVEAFHYLGSGRLDGAARIAGLGEGGGGGLAVFFFRHCIGLSLAQTLHALRKAAPKRTQILYRCEGEQDGGKVVVKDNIS